MNLLKTIIERLNQRVEVANIFDQIYPLCELNANGNEKAWVHYIGNGQAEVVTNFDAKQGTLFWAKRGKVSVTKTESLKVSGCKTLYQTTFPLTAYAVVRKSHLPCDSEDSQDWIASRIYRLISGTDPDFKVAIGVIQYEVIPNGYVNEIKSLTANYEWACVAVDVDVSVVSSSEDGCYDVCSTGDIPLPDFEPCTPCLTEVAVDGVTITGNGTTADPLVAIGGGGGGGVMTAIAFSTDHLASTGNQYLIGNVVWYNGNIYRCIANNDSLLPTNTTYWVNLGAGFETIERPINWNATSGNNQILNKPTIPAAQVNSDWNSTSGLSEILNKPTIPILPATIVEDVTATAPMASTGGTTPDISITQADGSTDGYLSSTDWNTFDGKFDVPTGTITDYLDGLGTPTAFPTIPNAQVNSDWNAVSGVAEILNKPTIPAAQIQSDWTQANNAAVDFIKNKPTIPSISGLVPYTGATNNVDLGTHTLSAKDLVINHPSGSGVAASITKGGSGEALTVVKSSGSGNAASITGGVTLIDELHLTTDLADAYIASAATWNAKQDALTLTTTGTSGAATLTGATLNIPQYSGGALNYKTVVDSAGFILANLNTIAYTQLIPANNFAQGDIIRVTYRTRKTGTNAAQTLRIYVNSTSDLLGTPVLLGTFISGVPSFLVHQMQRHLAIKNVTNNTEVFVSNGNTAVDFNVLNGVTTCVIDWTTARYFIFTMQSFSLTDLNYGSMYLIEKL
jgi:hypothetical protein